MLSKNVPAHPRLFSIDGGHTAAITDHDMSLAARSLSSDGLTVLDDFFNEPWPGVAEGACRYLFAPTVPLFPVAIAGNKFAFAKDRRAAALYRHELSLPSALFERRDTEVFGEPVVVYTPIRRRSVAERLRRSRKVRKLGKFLTAWRR